MHAAAQAVGQPTNGSFLAIFLFVYCFLVTRGVFLVLLMVPDFSCIFLLDSNFV
jgi:hypothetical protein